MQFRMKLAGVAIAGIAALGLSVPALASSHPGASKPITGPEVLAGAVHGKEALVNAPRIPLRWRGLVNTHSVIKLGGGGPHKGSRKTLKTPKGKLTVKITAKPTQSQAFNPKTCRIAFNEYIQVAVVSGKSTGAFAGASGPGAVEIHFAAKARRYKKGPHKGQCNPNARPYVKGAIATFLASFVLTVG
jgi:hypothetical protein